MPYPDGETIHVIVEDMRWQPGIGNTASIHGAFLVAVRSGEDFARKQFELSGTGKDVDAWLENNGVAIGSEIDSFRSRAAERIWSAIDR